MPESQVIKDPYKDLKPMIVEISMPGDIDKHIVIATIKSQDPLACIVLSAWVINHFKMKGLKPVVKIIQ